MSPTTGLFRRAAGARLGGGAPTAAPTGRGTGDSPPEAGPRGARGSDGAVRARTARAHGARQRDRRGTQLRRRGRPLRLGEVARRFVPAREGADRATDRAKRVARERPMVACLQRRDSSGAQRARVSGEGPRRLRRRGGGLATVPLKQVRAALADPTVQFERGPRVLMARGSETDEGPSFVVEDGRYVSGRWPGDSYRLARALIARLTAPSG